MKFESILIALCAALSAPATAQTRDSFEGRLLAVHNAERARLGIAPLAWSTDLAAQAGVWAVSLAQRGAFEHSKDRQGAGENLWMGTAGYYSPEAMIGAFVSEGRNFRRGTFPSVSATGNWFDVGHYTQLIWPATQMVGCSLATAKGRDVLVCRYLPAGNMIGQKVP